MLTDIEIKDVARDALQAWFKDKIRAAMPEEHKAMVDSDLVNSLSFGGMFDIDVREMENGTVRINVATLAMRLMEQIADFAPIFVERILHFTGSDRQVLATPPFFPSFADKEDYGDDPYAGTAEALRSKPKHGGWGDEWGIACNCENIVERHCIKCGSESPQACDHVNNCPGCTECAFGDGNCTGCEKCAATNLRTDIDGDTGC